MHGLNEIIGINKAVVAAKKETVLTREDVYLICNALNADARSCDELRVRRPDVSEAVLEHTAQLLRKLTVRLLSAETIRIAA